MRAKGFVCALLVGCGLFGAAATPVFAQTPDAQAVRQEIDQLRRDFEAVKQQYGDRLTALEASLAQLQGAQPPAAAAPPAAPPGQTATAAVPPGAEGAGGPSGALPFSAALRNWGPINMRQERTRVLGAIERLQIDTRAQREVQRLSGGNQQKVTIARWIAAEARTVLCFDPTRGIDVGTKQEIYRLLRELADHGSSVLFYTSELEEVQRVCDRAIVIFGGRVVDVLPVEIADEAALTRAAYGLPRGAQQDVGVLAGAPRDAASAP